jgi:predicted 2-oxoglutarate/Fe(II)-dependent dioxygenase YbiX
MSIITIKSAIPKDLIDSWNSTAEHIPSRPSRTFDKSLPSGISNDRSVRSCEVRVVTFNNHRKFYLDILNNIYPFIDFHQHIFNVQLHRVLEMQHITYFENDHYVKHTDVISNNKAPLHRKISLVLMLSDISEYSGGELMINNESVQLEKGDMVMFNPTTVHAVEKVQQGVRKTLVMWALGPQWR